MMADDRVTWTVRVPGDLALEVDRICADRSMVRNKVVVRALERLVEHATPDSAPREVPKAAVPPQARSERPSVPTADPKRAVTASLVRGVPAVENDRSARCRATQITQGTAVRCVADTGHPGDHANGTHRWV